MVATAYLDESENREAGLFGVGGFVGPDDAWMELEPKWLAALPRGIDYFHATDCFVGQNQFRRCEGLDIPERLDLLNRLTDLLCETDVRLICYGIDVPAYMGHAPKPKMNEFLINRYVAPFEWAVQTSCRDYLPMPPGYPSDMTSDDKCNVVFEQSDYLATAIRAAAGMRISPHLWWANRIAKVTHGTKTGSTAIPLLQVADLGAFLGMKVLSAAPDGRIPWTPFYEKLVAANRVFGRPGKIDERSMNLLRGLQEESRRQEEKGTSYWDDL
jgi:hypothetical protein